MIAILLTAFALSMDAGAISICIGLRSNENVYKISLASALWFAIFQGLMTFFGFVFASSFLKALFDYGKYFAFAILLIVGIKMLLEARQCKTCSYSSKNIKLFFILALTTSLDAFAVGMAYSLTNINLPLAVTIISLVTFLVSLILCLLAKSLNSKYQTRFEILGAVILIILAIKQLF